MIAAVISDVCAADTHLGCPDADCRCFHHASRHRVDHRSESVEAAAFAEQLNALGSLRYVDPLPGPDRAETQP